MPTIRVRDIETYYDIRGEGEPLLMITGFMANADCWDPLSLLPALAERYKVILFDNRGSARTTYPGALDEELSIKTMADDAAALLDALGIEKAHVFGISMGGMIAEQLVIHYPEKVKKLILASTFCGGHVSEMIPDEASNVIMDIVAAVEAQGGWNTEIARLLIPNIFTEEYVEENPGIVDVVVELILASPTGVEAINDQVFAILSLDVGEDLRNVTAPTLVIAGKKDTYIPPENSRVIVERIAGSQLQYFEKSGHMLQEESEAVAETVLSFLNAA